MQSLVSVRLQAIEEQGKKIYYTDFSGLNEADFLVLLKKAMDRDMELPEKSLLLQDISGTVLTDKIKVEIDKGAVIAKRKKYIFALLGITGIKRIVAQAINRNTFFTKDIEQAKDWLLKQ